MCCSWYWFNCLYLLFCHCGHVGSFLSLRLVTLVEARLFLGRIALAARSVPNDLTDQSKA